MVLSATAVILMLAVAYTLGANHALTPSHVYAADTCQTFTQTGHQACGAFLQYWNDHGGLAQQGFPISEPLMEVSATDGKTYQVQYFERAVFEMHPENAPPYNVLLSLLGSEKYKTRYNGTAPPGIGTAAAATATNAHPALANIRTSTPVRNPGNAATATFAAAYAASEATGVAVYSLPSTAHASPNGYSCRDFQSQAAAQEWLRQTPEDPSGLDPEKRGIACPNNPAPFDRTLVPR